jgi:multiple sugar transport system substrate-binding protein
MSFVRPARRVGIAVVSLSALLAAAACGGGGSTAPAGNSSTPAAADFTQKGPITYVSGKDVVGYTNKEIARWNAAHPDEKVTFQELPDNADLQRQQMLQNAQVKSDKMSVLSVDVVWTAEFAAKQIVDELPADQFPTTGLLPGPIDSAKYFNKLYAAPWSSDGALLYYRKDLLDAAGLKPPTTWDEMKQACTKIKGMAGNAKMDCYAGQYNKYEGLTVNFAEAVNSAGGNIIGEDGKPAVNSPEAVKGLQFLVDSFKDGTIPKGAITWQEEQGRQAFQSGKLIFNRNWPGIGLQLSATDGTSKVNGKYEVAPLPGLTGVGVSSLGGHNLAISKYAKNKGTALDFIKFMTSDKEQRQRTKDTTNAPVIEALYTDTDLQKTKPYLPTLAKSLATAKPRPKAVQYGDVTLAIQDAAYAALQGNKEPKAALDELQTKLEGLTKK